MHLSDSFECISLTTFVKPRIGKINNFLKKTVDKFHNLSNLWTMSHVPHMCVIILNQLNPYYIT